MEQTKEPIIEILLNRYRLVINPDCTCDDILDMMADKQSFIIITDINKKRFLIPKNSILIIGQR